ncbi:glutathione ABC transporter ATP-binding protein, partial [Bifidobacterium breve]|nr:glutathione ABC transporter ATP-binding protein [Bifidobacterium breve]
PQADYTKRLLAAVPRIGQQLMVRDAAGHVIERSVDWREEPVVVKAEHMDITYPGQMQPDFKAVDDVSFEIHKD